MSTEADRQTEVREDRLQAALMPAWPSSPPEEGLLRGATSLGSKERETREEVRIAGRARPS